MSAFPDHETWRAAHVNSSRAFAQEIAELAAIAERDRRVSRRFAEMTYAEVLAGERIPVPADSPRVRPYAWSEKRCREDGRVFTDPDESGKAMRSYAGRCMQGGRRYFGATAAGSLLHAMAAGSAPARVAPVTSSGDAPTDAIASTAAAALTGADFGTPNARSAALSKVTRPVRDSLRFEAADQVSASEPFGLCQPPARP